MTKRLFLLPVLMIGSAAAFGCSATPEEDSCNIKTPGIYVQYHVAVQGNSARATAEFWVGDAPDGTHLTLGDCGDEIQVNGQGMGESDGEYVANLAPADSYEFVFSREEEDPYSSVVSAPAAVNITAPTAGTSISRAEAFDLVWENNRPGSIDLFIEGDCISDFPNINGDTVTDNGTYTVNAGEIEPHMSSDADKSCTAEVSLKRGASGALDSHLDGEITASSRGTTSFTSTP